MAPDDFLPPALRPFNLQPLDSKRSEESITSTSTSAPSGESIACKPRPITPPDNPFIFEAGDTNILVTYNNERVVGRVCSQALIHASPVWKKFLIPPWAEDDFRISEVSQIDCSEDDGTALLILLNIAHLNFKAVPRDVSYPLLFQLAVLIDQYQCVNLVSPWLRHWMANEKEESLAQGQEGWLFIAWAFGRSHIFETLARKVLLTAKLNAKGELWRLYEDQPIPEPMPNDLIGK